MSYDFLVIVPERATSDIGALQTASRVAEARSAPSTVDPRLDAFVADLAAEEPPTEADPWLDLWPLEPVEDGVLVPTAHGRQESSLVTLLRIAARHRLVVVDVDESMVYRPTAGLPISLTAGSGLVAGAVTREHLAQLVRDFAEPNPWLILGRATMTYAQCVLNADGSYSLEYQDGDLEHHYETVVLGQDRLVDRLWGWVRGDRDWDAGLAWRRYTF